MKYGKLYFKVDTKVIEISKAMMEVSFKILPRNRFFFMVMFPFCWSLLWKKMSFSANFLFVNCYEMSLAKTYFKQKNDM